MSTGAFLIKRLLLAVPTFIGITILTFCLMKLAPGNPAQMKLLLMGGDKLTPEYLATLANSKDDDSIDQNATPLQKFTTLTTGYGRWSVGLLRGELGFSSLDYQPVSKKILNALPVTLAVNGLTIALVLAIGIPLGAWSALRAGTFFDKVLLIKLTALAALPTFWTGALVIKWFAGGDGFNLFPLSGLKSFDYATLSAAGKAQDVLWHLVLPVGVATLGSLAYLTRFSRDNILETLTQDYVRTARAKGLAPLAIMWHHVLRPALLPFVTLLGSLLPALIAGSVILEQLFGIPGLGQLAFQATLTRDYNVIMALTAVTAILTLFGLILQDVLYRLIDPRVGEL